MMESGLTPDISPTYLMELKAQKTCDIIIPGFLSPVVLTAMYHPN